MTFPRLRARSLPLAMVAGLLLAFVAAPAATLLPRLGRSTRRVRDDESGEIVQNILWVAGFAAIAIAVVAIIRTFVLGEAANLPTSGNVGG